MILAQPTSPTEAASGTPAVALREVAEAEPRQRRERPREAVPIYTEIRSPSRCYEPADPRISLEERENTRAILC